MSSKYVKQDELPPCKHNAGVACPEDRRYCRLCGWNPAVSSLRLMDFCEAHGLDIKEVLKDDAGKSDTKQACS